MLSEKDLQFVSLPLFFVSEIHKPSSQPSGRKACPRNLSFYCTRLLIVLCLLFLLTNPLGTQPFRDYILCSSSSGQRQLPLPSFRIHQASNHPHTFSGANHLTQLLPFVLIPFPQWLWVASWWILCFTSSIPELSSDPMSLA